jgi:hypothetical protein
MARGMRYNGSAAGSRRPYAAARERSRSVVKRDLFDNSVVGHGRDTMTDEAVDSQYVVTLVCSSSTKACASRLPEHCEPSSSVSTTAVNQELTPKCQKG